MKSKELIERVTEMPMQFVAVIGSTQPPDPHTRPVQVLILRWLNFDPRTSNRHNLNSTSSS